MAAKRVEKHPKEFVPNYGGNMAAEFELWLEDVNAICEVTDQEDKKRLFMNLSRLDLRRITKNGWSFRHHHNQEDGLL